MFSRVPLVAAGALSAVALAACGSDPAGGEASDLPRVEISVTHPDDLYGVPWLIGRQEGFFEDAGIVIDKIIPAEGGGATLQNVVAGRLPFGEVATGAVVKGHREGAPIQVVGGAVQSVFDVLWVAAGDSGPATAADAAGARWGYTNPGSVTEAMSYLVPEALGLGEVTRESTGGTGAGIALLEAGDVDLAYAPPRVVAEQADALRVVVDSSDHVRHYQQTVIISSRDYAEQYPERAEALLEGYQRSVEWIRDQPSAAAAAWAESVDIDPAVAEDLVVRAVEADHWGVAFNPEALAAVEAGLAHTDGIDAVDWTDLATDTYLPEEAKGELP